MANINEVSCNVSELEERIEELEKRLEEANRRFSLFAASEGNTGGNNRLSNLQLAILDSLHDVVAAILDRDGNYLAAWADPKLTSRYGLDTSQVVGRNLRDIFPPEEAEDHIEKLRACFDEGATHREENPVPMPNGIFWHDTIISPLRDSSGKVVAALKFAQDITNSKRLERDLEASENLYQAVLEQVTEFIVVHSKGRIMYANRAAAEAAGFDSKEKMRGMSVLELVHPDSRELVEKRLALAANAKGPLPPMEEKFIGKNGKVFIGEVVSQPVQLDGEKAILTVVRDITERRKLEEEKNRMRERASSTRRIESLSLMALGMAHDFNNLLLGVLGNASMLRAELPESSREHELARKIEKCASAAAEVTRQLLDFADRSRPSAPLLDVARQVESCVDMLSSQIPDSILVRTDLEKNLPPVSILPAHLNQLLLNLVKNGIEAIPERGGTITISARCREIGKLDLDRINHDHDLVPGKVVSLEVDDEGEGINKEILERIFDPFFSTKEAGRGLGLAGAMGIAMRYGGTIRVTSRPSAGSHFEVWLPPAEA